MPGAAGSSRMDRSGCTWSWRPHPWCGVSRRGAEGSGEAGFSIVAHTGLRSAVQECLLDESGRLYLFDGRVLGLVHTLDMELAARAVEQGLWTPADVRADELPRRYGYVQRPSELRD